MTLVVDAAVAVKWVLDENGSSAALALRAERGLIAPTLIYSEVGSAIWKAVRRKLVKESDAIDAFQVVFAPFEVLVPEEELGRRALEIAIALDHPIYDCFYLALAERERAQLVTADRKMLKAADRLKSVEARPL